MALVLDTGALRDGRRWSVSGLSATSARIDSLSRTYRVVRSDATAVEGVSFTGVPALGSRHPAQNSLVVVGYDVQERTGAEKAVLDVTVRYGVSIPEYSLRVNSAPPGQACEAWGWKSATVSRDLTTNLGSGKSGILNSAGQPFESVPQIEVATPVLTKVLKTTARQNWAKYRNTINKDSVTISGKSYDPHLLRVVQLDEERLWNDEFGFKYRYTIALQVMSNIVSLGGSAQPEDIGWDIAITDAGCYELVGESGSEKLVRISRPDAESGEAVPVTSPVLLDGEGHQLVKDQTVGDYIPYNFRIQAYAEESFPADFTSEPDGDDLDDSDTEEDDGEE